jgi:hypothetical protein
VNHGEDQDEEDVEVIFIGAKNPWHTFVVDLRRFAFEEPNIKHEMMIKNPRMFVSLLYCVAEREAQVMKRWWKNINNLLSWMMAYLYKSYLVLQRSRIQTSY